MTPSSRRAVLTLTLLSALGLVGCPAPPDATGPDASCPEGQRALGNGQCAPTRSCGQGFAADPEGVGCLEVLATACDAGTMPVLGSTLCQPVGWTSCPEGFAPHASGWGCAPVLPPAPCPAGSVERLGSSTCVPLGDCAGAFPPAAATVFVDDDSTTVDATHFASLADAIAAAPPASTIAVEAGAYAFVADVAVTKKLTVVGRCAAQVTVSRTGAAAGLVVKTGGTLFLSGMTLQGLDGAPWVTGGGKAVLEDVDVQQSRWVGADVSGASSALTLRRARVANTQPTSTNHYGWGVVAERGGTLTLEDVVVERNQGNNVVVKDANSKGTLTRTVVRDGLQAPIEGVGVGLSAGFGPHVEIRRSVFSHNRLRNLSIASASTTVLVEESVLEDAVQATTQSGRKYIPAGITVEDGAQVTLNRSALGTTASLLNAMDPGSSVEVTGTVFRDLLPETFSAVWAMDGAHLGLDSVAIVSAVNLGLEVSNSDAVVKRSLVANTRLGADGLYGVGAQVSGGGTLRLEGSAFVANAAVGFITAGTSDAGVPSHSMVSQSVFLDTRTGAGGLAGHGVNVNSGARLDMSSCAVVGNHEAGLSVSGGVASVFDSNFRGTARNGRGDFGHGIIGVPSADVDHSPTAIHLSNVSVTGNASVGLMAAGMAGSVQNSTFERNETGVHAQDGTTVEQAEAPPASLGPLQLVITNDTIFFGNATVAGTGTVPLPRSLTSPTLP